MSEETWETKTVSDWLIGNGGDRDSEAMYHQTKGLSAKELENLVRSGNAPAGLYEAIKVDPFRNVDWDAVAEACADPDELQITETATRVTFTGEPDALENFKRELEQYEITCGSQIRDGQHMVIAPLNQGDDEKESDLRNLIEDEFVEGDDGEPRNYEKKPTTLKELCERDHIASKIEPYEADPTKQLITLTWHGRDRTFTVPFSWNPSHDQFSSALVLKANLEDAWTYEITSNEDYSRWCDELGFDSTEPEIEEKFKQVGQMTQDLRAFLAHRYDEYQDAYSDERNQAYRESLRNR